MRTDVRGPTPDCRRANEEFCEFSPRPEAIAAAGGERSGVANAANTTYEAAPGPGVTINGTSCYFTNRLVNPVNQTWVRERVCTAVAP